MLLTVTTVEWLVYEVFLYTNLFTGPEQFLIQLVLTVMTDLYFMLYCPCMWTMASLKEGWAGWGRGRRGNYFYYVRKPDPREELTRIGYFSSNGHFSYIRKSFLENRKRLQRDHSVYEITKPLVGVGWDHNEKSRVVIEQQRLVLNTPDHPRKARAQQLHNTIIQVDPVDLVQQKNIKETVPNTSQYLAHSLNNVTVHAEVHRLPEVTD
jgi:hypothetical protein